MTALGIPNPLRWLKEKMSIRSSTDLDFRFIELMWGEYTWNTKACIYWWVLLPVTIIAFGVITIFSLIAFALEIFFGRCPTDMKEGFLSPLYPPGQFFGGRRWPWLLQPWFWVLLLILGWFTSSFPEQSSTLLWWLIEILLGCLVVGVVALIIGRNWNSPILQAFRTRIGQLLAIGWGKAKDACPPLKVKEPGE
jgi:hypothetical protein